MGAVGTLPLHHPLSRLLNRLLTRRLTSQLIRPPLLLRHQRRWLLLPHRLPLLRPLVRLTVLLLRSRRCRQQRLHLPRLKLPSTRLRTTTARHRKSSRRSISLRNQPSRKSLSFRRKLSLNQRPNLRVTAQCRSPKRIRMLTFRPTRNFLPSDPGPDPSKSSRTGSNSRRRTATRIRSSADSRNHFLSSSMTSSEVCCLYQLAEMSHQIDIIFFVSPIL